MLMNVFGMLSSVIVICVVSIVGSLPILDLVLKILFGLIFLLSGVDLVLRIWFRRRVNSILDYYREGLWD